MRYALIIALLNLRESFRSKANLAMMFALPLLLTVIFGMLFGGSAGDTAASHVFPVAVVDRDRSFASGKLVEALQQENTLRLLVVPESDLARLFADKQIDSGLIIPAGFEQAILDGQQPGLQLQASPGGNRNFGVSPAIQREAARVAGDLLLARRMVSNPGDQPQVAAAYERVAAERKALDTGVVQEPARIITGQKHTASDLFASTGLGFTVMFVMMTVLMGGGVILRERQMGTWGRLLTTPAPRIALLAGFLLSFFLTGMAQFIILWGLTGLIFHLSWGPVVPLLTMAAALVLCSGAMGLFLAGIVRTHEQQIAAGSLLVTATSMLGGVYWPLDLVSPTMQRIGYLTPQAWAMEGFREVMFRGGAWGTLLWPLVVLLSLTVIFMTVGLLRVRYE
jgi:ABC-2 type transport system permease protein